MEIDRQKTNPLKSHHFILSLIFNVSFQNHSHLSTYESLFHTCLKLSILLQLGIEFLKTSKISARIEIVNSSSFLDFDSYILIKVWTLKCNHLNQWSCIHSKSSLFEVNNHLRLSHSLGNTLSSFHFWSKLICTNLKETHFQIKEHWFSSNLQFRST